MKKTIKTAEETLRDELVLAVRHEKDSMEHTVRTIKRRQAVLSMLPEGTREYKDFLADLTEDKYLLIAVIRSYEAKREALGEHCRAHHLSGNTFISAYELLEILAEKA